MAKRLPDEQRQEIKSRYLAGMSSVQISASLGLGTTTVLRTLKALDVSPAAVGLSRQRQGSKIKKEDHPKIISQYQSGLSLSELADHYKVTHTSIKYIIKKYGYNLRGVGGVYTNVSESTLSDIVRMWDEGCSHQRIADHFSLTRDCVRTLLTKQGRAGERRKAMGAKHGQWKGGRRTTTAGYIYVRLEFGDPFFSMSNVSGYVLEHRLVMARSLGRPLHPWETVHHIDGDKKNNMPENLQLRFGKHGTNVVYECACCGSRDLRAVELA